MEFTILLFHCIRSIIIWPVIILLPIIHDFSVDMFILCPIAFDMPTWCIAERDSVATTGSGRLRNLRRSVTIDVVIFPCVENVFSKLTFYAKNIQDENQRNIYVKQSLSVLYFTCSALER